MFKVFQRDKKSQNSVEGGSPQSRKGRRGVAEADSFVFMPGDSGDNYWGKIINDDSFPNSQRFANRRKTHIGLDSSSGHQGVNVVIRTHLNTSDNDEKILLNGQVPNRRYSGTLVKGYTGNFKKAGDGEPVIRDYASLLSAARERKDTQGRCAYDRLVRTPLQPADSRQKRMTLVADSQLRDDTGRCLIDVKGSNAHSSYDRDEVEQIEWTGWPSKQRRPASVACSHRYSGVEWAPSTSGQAQPADAINWELNLGGMWATLRANQF